MWEEPTPEEPSAIVSFDEENAEEHVKTLLEPTSNTNKNSASGSPVVRVCPYCSYRTTRMTHLKRHVLCRHTNHRPHKCKYCSYKAVQSWHLQRHMMTHTGEKPYKCPVCPYRSSRNEQLRSHMFRHVKKPGASDKDPTTLNLMPTTEQNDKISSP